MKTQVNMSILKPFIEGKTTHENMVMSEGYRMTDLDIWILATNYNIPIVLFNVYKFRTLFEKKDDIEWVLMSKNTNEKFYFIRSNLTTIVETEQKPYSLIEQRYHFSELIPFQEKTFQSMLRDSMSKNENNVLKFNDYIRNYII